VTVNHRQETSVPGVFAAGEVTGIAGVALAVVEGEIAGAAAAGVERPDPSLVRRRHVLRGVARRLERAFAVRDEIRALARADTIICRCEDVRHGDVASLGDARQAKLYARAGMGACQGRVCGPALEFLFGWPAGTVRPPLEPARLSALSVAATSLATSASPAPQPSPSGS
jgi:NADPH-dependent 2,4-dienoyl-CoA reductase/sulfur reductase-like enzyme